MFKIKEEEIGKGITKYKVNKNTEFISFRNWIDYMKESTEFIEFYIEILMNSKYEGYFWEVKPINKNKLDENFEFVLIESNSLKRIVADDSSFKKYFKEGEDVVTFPNLGGDAQLIVPTQIRESSNYNHLASFMRKAPKSQAVNFWTKVAEEYDKLMENRTKWLSTAGLGVYWLHVRIDSRPKYYRFAPYRTIT
jgi:hypothetical protein